MCKLNCNFFYLFFSHSEALRATLTAYYLQQKCWFPPPPPPPPQWLTRFQKMMGWRSRKFWLARPRSPSWSKTYSSSFRSTRGLRYGNPRGSAVHWLLSTQHCYMLHTAPGDWGMGTPEVLLCTDSCQHNTTLLHVTHSTWGLRYGNPRGSAVHWLLSTQHCYMLHTAPGDWGMGTPEVLLCTDSCQHNTTLLHVTHSTWGLRYGNPRGSAVHWLLSTQHCYMLHTAPGDWGMGTPEVLLCTDSCQHNTTLLHVTHSTWGLRYGNPRGSAVHWLLSTQHNIVTCYTQHLGTEVWEPQRFCCALTPVNTTLLHVTHSTWGLRYGNPRGSAVHWLLSTQHNIVTCYTQHLGTEVWEPQRFCCALTPVNTCVTCYMQHQETEAGEPLRFCSALTPVNTTHMLHAAPRDWGRGTPVILPCTDSCQCNTTKPTLQATGSTRRLR